MEGVDGATVFGCHHSRRADLGDLDDVWVGVCTEGGDGSGHGLGVVALVNRLNVIVGLGCVEIIGKLVNDLAELTSHGMPKLNLMVVGETRGEVLGAGLDRGAEMIG